MRLADLFKLTLGSILSYRMRSVLTSLGITVGIAAVVLLTSIGEGVHKYVLGEFTQFGTNLIAVTPGKASTFGISGAIINNVRPMSLEDSNALSRLPGVKAVVPVVQGNAAVEFGKKTRRGLVFGVGPAVPEVWSMRAVQGRFLPDDDPRYARPFVVLGNKMGNELFGSTSPLGKRIRIGGESFRVIGVMEAKGQMLGFDLDDAVYIPTRKAMAMFDQDSLMEIDLLYSADMESGVLAGKIGALLKNRQGSEDFTIVTQDQMLETLGNVLGILTLAVASLGAISLLVGGVGILTIMTISVNERTAEVGLLRALGAPKQQILWLFMGEAILLSTLGGMAGLLLGTGGAWLLGAPTPALPVHTSWFYVLLSEGVAIAIGVSAGVAPALHASRLDPIQALHAE